MFILEFLILYLNINKVIWCWLCFLIDQCTKSDNFMKFCFSFVHMHIHNNESWCEMCFLYRLPLESLKNTTLKLELIEIKYFAYWNNRKKTEV